MLLDLIVRNRLPIEIFTLDTGRLHEETYALMQQTEERYGRVFEVVFPPAQAVEKVVAIYGINGFFDSIQARRACCDARKVQPLERALLGRGAWVTGQRAEQSVTRAGLSASEPDPARGLLKFNPLHDWSEAEVWNYLKRHQVPSNALHSRGFPSIGCAPCTRAITFGEDARAGRWWWEQPSSRECGLHTRPLESSAEEPV